MFSDAQVLSIVADAVHVGCDDWLNVFVYDHSVGQVFICPPQVTGLQPRCPPQHSSRDCRRWILELYPDLRE